MAGLVQLTPQEVATGEQKAQGQQDEEENAGGAHKRCRVEAEADRKKLGKFIVVDVGVGEGSCILEGVLEVDIAGGREVPLIGVCELHVLGLITCVGVT